jgi:hypothetical protein
METICPAHLDMTTQIISGEDEKYGTPYCALISFNIHLVEWGTNSIPHIK